jgi:hypothetical protein
MRNEMECGYCGSGYHCDCASGMRNESRLADQSLCDPIPRTISHRNPYGKTERVAMTHELKIWPQYFARVKDGSKTFEVRENDRGFQPGDTVVLKEYSLEEVERQDHNPMGYESWMEPRGYTGKHLTFQVGYVYPLEDNRVVFSLLPPSQGA